MDMLCKNRGMMRRVVRGFTLLEMMLVVVIMGVLMAVAVVSISGSGTRAKTSATQQTLHTVGAQIKIFNLEKSAYPASLAELVPKYIEKTPLDAWKRPLVYSVTPGGQHPFSLYSPGEDNEPGTQDDIDYWTEDAPVTTTGR